MDDLSGLIASFSERRGGYTILLRCPQLDVSLLRPVHRVLSEAGRVDHLDLILDCRGGEPGAARRLGTLLHDFSGHLSIIVPFYAQSAATLLSCAANEIIASEIAIFSPFDAQLLATDEPSATNPASLSTEDIRLFMEMASEWFFVDSPTAGMPLLRLLAQSIFPTTLTTIYRSFREVMQVALELLALGQPEVKEEVLYNISRQLLTGYRSHSFPLSGSDLKATGLPVKQDKDVERFSMVVMDRALDVALYDAAEGAVAYDAMLATKTGVSLRAAVGSTGGRRWT